MIEKKQYVNVLKGVAIFLVTWGHCIQHGAGYEYEIFEDKIFQFIYSFHMPLFMLISGYLFYYSFSKRELKELLIHRVQSMLQPIIMFGVCSYFLTNGLKSVLSGNIGELFNGDWLNSLSDLWFLWSVMINSIWIGIVYKKCSKVYVRVIGLLLGFVFVMLFPNMMLNLYMYPYFVIGFLFNSYEDYILGSTVILKMRYISLVLFPLLFIFYEKEDFIYVSGMFQVGESLVKAMKIDVFRYVIGLVGSVFICVLLHEAMKRVKSVKWNYVAALGKKSLEIYCLNTLLIGGWLPVLANKFIKLTGITLASTYSILWDYVISFVLTLGYIAIMVNINKFLEYKKVSVVLYGR